MSAPGAPNVYKQPYASPSTLEFNWNPPSNDGGSPITGYRFTLQPGNIIDYAGSNDRYKTIPQLDDTTLYTTSIEATNDNGLTYGTPSFFRPFQPGTITAFGPSTVSAATLGVNSAVVSWTSPRVQPVSQNFWYVIYGRSSSAADPITSTSVSALTASNCIVRNLNSNASYYFDVHAVNCPGWSPAVSSPRISWQVVTDYLWEQNFNSGSNGFVNYNVARLIANTPSGTGFSYNTSGQYDLYRTTSFSATNTVTYCASVYMSNTGNVYPGIIFSRDYGAAASGLQIIGTGSQVGYSWNDSGSTWGFNTGISLTLNTWTHIVLRITSSNAQWFINGVLTGNTAANSHPALTFTRMYIGVDTVLAQNRTFPGYIDNCRFYTRALTDAEISAIYQNTLAT